MTFPHFLRTSFLPLFAVILALACKDKPLPPSGGSSAGSGGSNHTSAGSGGTLGGSSGGQEVSGEGGMGGFAGAGLSGSGGFAEGGMSGEGGAPLGGTGGTKPTSCGEGQWLCHGACVPLGSCQARELSLEAPILSGKDSPLPDDVTSSSAIIYDVNGDGHKDVIYSNYAEYNPNTTFTYRIHVADGASDCRFNNSNAHTLTEDKSPQARGFEIIAFKDLNGDKIPDILSGKKIAQSNSITREIVLIYLKPGGSHLVETLTAESLGLGQVLLKEPLALGDVDGDGGLDILVQSFTQAADIAYGPVFLLRRSKEGNLLGVSAPWQPGELFGKRHSGASFVDLDGDGKSELVASIYDENSSTSKTYFYSWNGVDWASLKVSFDSSIAVKDGVWKDIDFNGKIDFIGYGEVWRNKGDGNFEKSTLGPWQPSQGEMIDIDLDGNFDLLGCDGWHRGDGFGAYDTNPGKVLAKINHPSLCDTWADVTGDGLPDGLGIGGTTIACYPNVGKPILK